MSKKDKKEPKPTCFPKRKNKIFLNFAPPLNKQPKIKAPPGGLKAKWKKVFLLFLGLQMDYGLW